MKKQKFSRWEFLDNLICTHIPGLQDENKYIYMYLYTRTVSIRVSLLLPLMVMITVIEQGAWTDDFQRFPQPKLFCVSLSYAFKCVACNL